MKTIWNVNRLKKNGTWDSGQLKTLTNTSWLLSDKLITMFVGVFVTAIVARYFGPEVFGQFQYALAFVTLFTAISTLGLETLIVKAIVDKNYDHGTILYTSFILRVLGGCLLTVSAITLIRVIEPQEFTLHILISIMSLTMVFKSFEVIEYWIQTFQISKVSSLIRISSYIISAVLKILVVFLEGNLFYFALVYLFDAIFIGGALLIAYIKINEKSFKWKFDFSFAKNILADSWYLVLSGLMITVYMKIDQVMLGYMASSTMEVGIYAVAVTIASMWYFVPNSIIISFKPLIMNYKKNNNKLYLESLQRLYTIVAWTGIFFGILIALFSGFIINTLYGPEYDGAAKILLINVWAGIFAMLGSARSIWLICEGLQKYSLLYIGAGALLNVILNINFIPVWGGVGAAYATLLSQVVATLVIPLLIKQTRNSSIMMVQILFLKGIRNPKKLN